MGTAVARVVTVCTLVIAAGCASAETVEPRIKYLDDLTLDQAIAWFEERTLECLGPGEPISDPREWRCTHNFDDGSFVEVRITADRSGVSHIVGVANGFGVEPAASFLGTTVAGLAVPTNRREELTLWAHNHGASGGTRVVGSVSIELQRHSEHQAVYVAPAGS